MACDIDSRAPAARQGSPNRCPEAHRRAYLLRTNSPVPRHNAAYHAKGELWRLVRLMRGAQGPPFVQVRARQPERALE